MIFFVRSRQGYEQLAISPAWPPVALWVAPGVLKPTELATPRATGVAVTDFIEPSGQVDLASALETIREHHPGQAVWVDG